MVTKKRNASPRVAEAALTYTPRSRVRSGKTARKQGAQARWNESRLPSFPSLSNRVHESCRKFKDDTYRIHVGDYRVVYLVDDRQREVEVVAVGDRKDIYQ